MCFGDPSQAVRPKVYSNLKVLEGMPKAAVRRGGRVLEIKVFGDPSQAIHPKNVFEAESAERYARRAPSVVEGGGWK